MADPVVHSRESDAAKRRAFERVAFLIAEADADIAAGCVVDQADVDSWIESIGTERELPVPRSR